MQPPREVRRLNVADIYVGERRRDIRKETVAALTNSINDIGLMTPISVRSVGGPIVIDGEEVWDVPCLVAGAHRLAAAKSLGWEEIDCYILSADDIDAQIWEIDENLARAELTPAQTAEHLAKRKALWEQKNNAQSLRENTGRGRPREFTGETAEHTGQSKRSIQQAVSRGEKIAPDVLQAVQGTELDKGTALDALAKMPHAQQREAVKTKSIPVYKTPDEASDERVERVWKAYNALSYEERGKFRERLEEHEPAIFDETPAGRAA